MTATIKAVSTFRKMKVITIIPKTYKMTVFMQILKRDSPVAGNAINMLTYYFIHIVHTSVDIVQ